MARGCCSRRLLVTLLGSACSVYRLGDCVLVLERLSVIEA
jgi:hypothetical protein